MCVLLTAPTGVAAFNIGGVTFAELLCRVRVAACTENDITLLKSRVVHDGDETYPQDALHVAIQEKH